MHFIAWLSAAFCVCIWHWLVAFGPLPIMQQLHRMGYRWVVVLNMSCLPMEASLPRINIIFNVKFLKYLISSYLNKVKQKKIQRTKILTNKSVVGTTLVFTNLTPVFPLIILHSFLNDQRSVQFIGYKFYFVEIFVHLYHLTF